MKMEYVLMGKNSKTPLDNVAQIRGILSACFEDVGNCFFKITHKRTTYEMEYKVVKHGVSRGEANVFHLTLSLACSKKQKCAEVLEAVNVKFTECSEIRPYHVVVSYDDISTYYCNRAYPLFHEFERQIRNLVFKLLTKTFGAFWLDKTVSQELKNNLKVKMRMNDKNAREEKLIEIALHEMDMFQLEQYLFGDTRDVDPSQLLDVHLSREALAEMDKDQITSALESGRAKSIWDRYFAPKITVPELKEKLGLIRINRNKVAHCKPFYKYDYDAIRKILYDDGLIKQIEKAIDEISTKQMNTITIRDVIGGFATMLQATAVAAKIAAPVISSALIKFAEIGAAIRNSIDVKGIGAALQGIDFQLNHPGFQSALSVQPLQSAISQMQFQQKELFASSAITAAAQVQSQLQDSIRPLGLYTSALQDTLDNINFRHNALFQSPALQSAMQLQERLSAIGMGIAYSNDDNDDDDDGEIPEQIDDKDDDND